MTKSIVIFGTGKFAELVHYYLNRDDRYKVVGFTETEPKGFKFKDLLVVSFDEIETIFPPKDNLIFIAVGYNQLNWTRTRFYQEAKSKGYKFLTYIHPDALIASNVYIGDNCFVFERNNIQPFVSIGNNVILWSGNHIGHHSIIHNNVFVSSHCVVSGECEIGHNCFLGVNCTIIDKVNIHPQIIIGAGTVVTKDLKESGTYVGVPARRIGLQ